MFSKESEVHVQQRVEVHVQQEVKLGLGVTCQWHITHRHQQTALWHT